MYPQYVWVVHIQASLPNEKRIIVILSTTYHIAGKKIHHCKTAQVFHQVKILSCTTKFLPDEKLDTLPADYFLSLAAIDENDKYSPDEMYPLYGHVTLDYVCLLSPVATNILQQTERHFPYVYVESPTLNKLRSQQIRHFANFSKSQADHMLPSVRKNIDEMYQKQSVMLKMLQKDLVHAKKVQECHDRKHWEQQTRTAVHAKRQAAARAWRYFQDYELQMRAKLQKARTREEQTLVQTFQNGLKQHKEVVIADRRALKEKQLLLKNRVQKELESMEKRLVTE